MHPNPAFIGPDAVRHRAAEHLANPALATWIERFTERPSMQATPPDEA